MIRTDFVSNSSSSSFILRNFEKNVLDSLDERFINIINRCPEGIHFVKKDEENYSKELIDDLSLHGSPFKIDMNYQYEITLDLSKRKGIDKILLPLIKRILAESEKCCVDFGCDDCGEWTGTATQMATALELLFGFTAEQCEGFEYTSVKELIKGN